MTSSLIALAIVSLLLMAIGLAGTFLPIIPGIFIILAGASLFSIMGGFYLIGWPTLITLIVLTIIASLLESVANLYGAKKMGASKWGMLGAFIGSIVGLIFANVIGIIVGPFIGAVFFELVFEKKQMDGALKSGAGTILGFLGGTLMKFVIGCAMIAIFVWKLFIG